MRALASCLGGLLLLMLAAAPARTQPDLSRTTGPTLADTGSRAYAFHVLRFVSADGQRHYRVRVAVPKTPAPAGGFPALYLLDGNAALMELDEAALERQRAGGHAPVLVFIATDNDLRIDSAARSYDYTPTPADGAQEDALGRRSGGADAFLALIVDRVRPAVARLVALDPARQTLWGHSYGGLFALHALFTRPQAFDRYVAVDASLWWGSGQILQEAARFQARALPAPAALLMLNGRGAQERATPRAADAARSQAMQAARMHLPADAPDTLAAQLRKVPGLTVEQKILPGLSHGQTLGASLQQAMDFAGAP